MTTLTVTLVSDSSGVDVAASMAAFSEALATYVSEREIEDESIGNAVHAVFDQYPSASISLPALAGFALQKLNVQPENFKALEGRIMDYVRANADQAGKTAKDGTVLATAEEARTRTFAIGKGKGGGVKRWSDHPVKA